MTNTRNTLLAFVLVPTLITVGCASAKKSEAPAAAPVAEAASSTAANVKAAAETAKAEVKAVAASETTCIQGQDSRVIAIEAKGSGCNLNYTKGGKTSSVATSASGAEHCEKVAQKIRSKLEAAGYACK